MHHSSFAIFFKRVNGSGPSGWAPNIVQGRRYDLGVSPGRELWEQVSLLLRRTQEDSVPVVAQPEERMYGDPVLVTPRLGQGAFRVMVTDFYERRCAITRERSLPVLEAAHIKPVAESGTPQDRQWSFD